MALTCMFPSGRSVDPGAVRAFAYLLSGNGVSTHGRPWSFPNTPSRLLPDAAEILFMLASSVFERAAGVSKQGDWPRERVQVCVELETVTFLLSRTAASCQLPALVSGYHAQPQGRRHRCGMLNKRRYHA